MRVLMTGGGTGGHVNPAIAIANIIREREPESEIAFVGSERGIENKLVPKEGYELFRIRIQGIRRKLTLENIKTLALAMKAVSDCKKIIRGFKPDIVIGTGGYVCWPVVKAAADMGIPTVLHESNAVPGFAVKMLEKYVDKIFVNFNETVGLIRYPDKAVRVGNPLRKEFSSLSYEESREKLGIAGKYRYFVLSCGGSMGAQRINSEVIGLMKDYTSKHPEILHVHASGSIEFENMKKAFAQAGLDKCPNLQMLEYIYDMPVRMSAADVVISRSGAMTLSELAILGKAAVLIPSPNVTNDHQYKNAKVLGDADAAIVYRESGLEEGTLTKAVESLIEDGEKRRSMQINIRRFAVSSASDIIYKYIKDAVSAEETERLTK
ncbi:MAG: undecaprenyldiphospho-muramoylpentapeptide beta-N-acetylglucosaminyltransferase [Clostridia bacterium]|nr:undecaprenyldiphospho-muramoylpentapeptide beta-N-acetylglucosaminyltransferase [Clostridia bacterium]